MAEPVPAHELSRELVNLFHRARDSGETLTVEAMREELGVGHDDLDGMLAQLRERGVASEVAPGEWEAREEEQRAADAGEEGRVVVRTGEAEAEEDSAGALWAPGVVLEPTVRLTRAIAEALGDDALGQLVKAGLGDTDDGQVFLLEITP